MSEDRMKSALERAMERAEKIEVPEEKLREMQYRSEGESMAARFFRDPNYDLGASLSLLEDKARPYILKTLSSVLLKNLVLPRKEADIATNDKVFNGLMALKKNRSALQEAKEQLNNLANYYTQARKQHYDQLKTQFEHMMAQAIQQQTGSRPAGNLNVEQTPEFQENWRHVSGKLDAEYDKALGQLKEQIDSTP